MSATLKFEIPQSSAHPVTPCNPLPPARGTQTRNHLPRRRPPEELTMSRRRSSSQLLFDHSASGSTMCLSSNDIAAFERPLSSPQTPLAKRDQACTKPGRRKSLDHSPTSGDCGSTHCSTRAPSFRSEWDEAELDLSCHTPQAATTPSTAASTVRLSPIQHAQLASLTTVPNLDTHVFSSQMRTVQPNHSSFEFSDIDFGCQSEIQQKSREVKGRSLFANVVEANEAVVITKSIKDVKIPHTSTSSNSASTTSSLRRRKPAKAGGNSIQGTGANIIKSSEKHGVQGASKSWWHATDVPKRESRAAPLGQAEVPSFLPIPQLVRAQTCPQEELDHYSAPPTPEQIRQTRSGGFPWLEDPSKFPELELHPKAFKARNRNRIYELVPRDVAPRSPTKSTSMVWNRCTNRIYESRPPICHVSFEDRLYYAGITQHQLKLLRDVGLMITDIP